MKRRSHFVTAFKPLHMSATSNLAEAYHSSWSTSNSIHLSLVDAAYHDICDSILLEAALEEIGEGKMVVGTGPDERTRIAREHNHQNTRAKEYSNQILQMIDVVEQKRQGAIADFNIEPNATHRPDKWVGKQRSKKRKHTVTASRKDTILVDSTSSESDESGSSSRSKRGARYRHKRSKTFEQSFSQARGSKLLLSSYKKSAEDITCTIKNMSDMYEVIISRSPSCSCPYFKTRAKNTTQICKHIIWVYIKVLNISQDDDVIQQTALKPEELRTIIEQAPETIPGLAGSPPSHFTSSRTDANHRVSISTFKPTNTLTSTVKGDSAFQTSAEVGTNENRLTATQGQTNMSLGVSFGDYTQLSSSTTTVTPQLFTATQNHHLSATAFQGSPSLAEISGSSQQRFASRLPPDSMSPFLIKLRTGRIRRCAGCKRDFPTFQDGRVPNAPYDIVVSHREFDYFVNPHTQQMQLTRDVADKHYHVNPSCIRARNPAFLNSQLVIPAEVHPHLTQVHMHYISTYFGL